MLRWLTAGESHGPALVAILEGLPAHVLITGNDITDALARRRLGFGRGARMKFEADNVTILGGVRHGETQGGPIAIQVANTDVMLVSLAETDPTTAVTRVVAGRPVDLTSGWLREFIVTLLVVIMLWMAHLIWEQTRGAYRPSRTAPA